MKNLLYIIPLCILLSSCNKFLDVQPESEVSKDELFKTEEGFKEALNGVYTYSSGRNLYGGNLTFSNLDIMAQNYEFTDLRFQKVASFQYNDPELLAKNNTIWTDAYRAINNSNTILEVIDERKNLFRDQNFEIIKGEALALRAFLHFDLLRMFAPSFKSDPNARAIPYVTQVGTQSTPFSTVTEVLDKILQDLAAAEELLLRADPIASGGYVVGYPGDVEATEETNPNLFLQNRRHRMNYYAVQAQMARVLLYRGEYAASLQKATLVINSKVFPWTEQEDFFNADVSLRDKIFYKELIFAWYTPDAEDHLEALFSNENPDYSARNDQINQIYEVGGPGADDWRLRQWFRVVRNANTADRALLQKYTRNSTPLPNLHPLVAPAIRLSEMYYIAAEASYETDPAKGAEYLNTVRLHRGIGDEIPATLSKSEFIAELAKEARKEFYGESQVFYMHKRLHLNIVAANGQLYPAANQIFVFPIPIDEEAYRN
jgi:hypothetical protein